MSLLKDIFNFIFPQRCIMCRKRLTSKENFICTPCLIHLPLTNHHLVENNPLEKHFWGLFPIEKAASFFYHDGEKTRSILYHIKYYHHPEVGKFLAALYAEELKDYQFFKDIDAIVPIPLHWKRMLKRHYNQSHYIAQGISQSTGIPIFNDVVKRMVNNVSQTQVKKQERKENVKDIFKTFHPEKIKGKHILLVDDVTTTGSTITSCAQELAKIEGVKISILTLAIAGRSSLPIKKENDIDPSAFGIPLIE